jgi:uncharacterized protein YcaQ
LVLEIDPESAALFTLERHHLLERAPRERALEVVDDILGLNAQGALNYQISLWNRVAGLDTGFVRHSLYEDRSLVRSWFMRDTVHIIPSKRFTLFRRALEPGLMTEWNRWTIKTGRKEAPDSWEPLYRLVLDALDEQPLTMNQILAEIGWSGSEAKSRLHRLVREMSLRGLVCNARSSGPWYHNTQHTFARVDRWLQEAAPDSISEEEVASSLARMYLKAYGPASVSDFAYWTGVRVKDAKPVFESISDSTTEVKIADQKGKLLILEEDLEAIADVSEKPCWVRLLPEFDALIMGHRDKARFLDPDVKSNVFFPRADVAATIMVNGRVEGVWKIRKEKKIWRLKLSPFKDLNGEEKELLEKEVEGLREFSGFDIEKSWVESS